MTGEGDGQTSGPVLAGLVLTHQPALEKRSIRHFTSTNRDATVDYSVENRVVLIIKGFVPLDHTINLEF